MNEIAVALNTLRVGDFQARWDAAKQLEGYGAEVLVPLLTLLNAPEADADLDWFIARILGSLAYPESMVALGQLLERSEDEEVRLMAAQSLAGLGPSALAPLSSYLKDPLRQMTAVRALTQINRPEVVPLLLEVAQTGTAEARSLVFEALDTFVDPRIFSVLLDGLGDENPAVRKAAIAGLAMRTPEASATDLVAYLLPYLDDTDLGVATQAARALGRLATDRGAIALGQKGCESHLDPRLQQTIIQALGWIGSLTALDGLGEIWQRVSHQVPLPETLLQDILASFTSIQGVEERSVAVERVMELVRSPLLRQSPTLRAKAILSLGRLASLEMLPALVDLLADADYAVRLHVVAALKQIDPDGAYDEIQQRMKQSGIAPPLAEGLAIAVQEW